MLRLLLQAFLERWKSGKLQAAVAAATLLILLRAPGYANAGFWKTAADIDLIVLGVLVSWLILPEPQGNLHLPNIYGTQDHVYNHLKQWLATRPIIRNAVLLQYSGAMVVDLIDALLTRRARVQLHIQNPEVARVLGAQFQADRISRTLRDFIELWGPTNPKPGSLEVFLHDAPMSFRAAVIDGSVIALGWYLYTPQASGGDPDDTDRVKLRGHDQPGMLLFSGTAEFASFSKVVDEVVSRLGGTGSADITIRNGRVIKRVAISSVQATPSPS